MVTMPFQSALRRLSHFISFVFREGGCRLHSHEQVVIDAALRDLPSKTREVVLAQLKQPFFVERSSDRISVLRYYSASKDLALEDDEFKDRLVKVQVEIDGRKQSAHVTYYKGYIFSVEFKKPGKFYVGKQITILGVSQGKPGESYTRALDRLEHGRNLDDAARR